MRTVPGRTRIAAVAAGATGIALAVSAAAPERVRLTIAEFGSTSFSVHGVDARLEGPDLSRFRLRIAEVAVAGHRLRDLGLDCSRARVTPGVIACDAGVLHWAGTWPVRGSYDRDRGVLNLEVAPAGRERLSIVADLAGDAPQVRIEADAVELQRFVPWLPRELPRPKAGRVAAAVTVDPGRSRIRGTARIGELAFSDPAGTRAAEKVALSVSFEAARSEDGSWNWKASGDWEEGEVYWHPFYVAAARQRLAARGSADPEVVDVHEGELVLPDIGSIRFSGRWDVGGGKPSGGRVDAEGLDVAGLYRSLLKPLALETPFAELRASGTAGLSARWTEAGLEEATLSLNGVSVEDERRRFAAFQASGRLPWHASRPTEGIVNLAGGEVLSIPFGATALPLRFEGGRIALRGVAVPLLGGTLTIRDALAERSGPEWAWTVAAGFDGVSVANLCATLGWPVMHGRLSADLPRATYTGATLRVGGALRFEVFGGEVAVADLAIEQPFGRAPRLSADVQMYGLDLGMVTRTFAFGSMTGRIDARLSGLELQNWKPVRFDARVESSPGDYPRRISQRAIESLSELGGGGAAAIQSLFLGLFEEFGYARLGWGCILRDGVCEMSGIAPRGDAYLLVEGGGLPSITVLGYNRRVSWEVLVARLQRIVRDDAKPVIR